MARIYSNFSHCSKKSSTSPPDPRVSLIGQKRNIPNYFKSLPLRVPSFVFRHIFCCKIAEIQSQSKKSEAPRACGARSGHGQVGWMPRLPAGRQGGEGSNGLPQWVKADPIIISTSPGTPALYLPARSPASRSPAEGRRFGKGRGGELHSLIPLSDQSFL